MTDTTPEIAEMVRTRLMALSGAERFRMGAEMFEAARRMATTLDSGGKSLVLISSTAARIGSPNVYVDYAGSKAAVDALAIGLSKELAADGVRVNCVRPGLIDTEIHACGGLPDRVRDLAPNVPMQRGGRPQEVAQAILWLLSDQASYTTMGLLDVSGGR